MKHQRLRKCSKEATRWYAFGGLGFNSRIDLEALHMREIYVESTSNGVRLYTAKHAGPSPLSNSFLLDFFFFSLDMYNNGIGLKSNATAIQLCSSA